MATTVAITMVATATIRLLRIEDRMAGLVTAFAYQPRVKPSQDADSRLRLKESATRTKIGA